MAVLNSVIGRVKPGRLDDLLAMSLEATKLMERLGAQHPRLAAAVAAGEAGGDTFTFSTEHENGEAWGEFSDRLAADAEFQAFVGRSRDANSPSTIEQISLSYEIPLRQCNPERGNVIEVHVSRPIAGRFQQGLDEASRVLELVEQRGATNARLFELGYAGMGSGLMALSWEFATMKAHGRLADQWTSDPEMAEIAMNARFGTAPATTSVWDGLYQVIPL
jgi:hypothetical protein